jgi:hypothetical protein
MAVVINHSDPGAVPGASTIRDQRSEVGRRLRLLEVPMTVIDR